MSYQIEMPPRTTDEVRQYIQRMRDAQMGGMAGGQSSMMGGLGGLGGLRTMAPQYATQNPMMAPQGGQGMWGSIMDALRTNANRKNPDAKGENDIWKIIAQMFGSQMLTPPIMSLMMGQSNPAMGPIGGPLIGLLGQQLPWNRGKEKK